MPKKPGDRRRSIISSAWRTIRGLYYWPAQLVAHAIRLSRHKSDSWYRITAPWILNSRYPDKYESNRPADWFKFDHRFTFTNEHVRFDIDQARRVADVKGLALMFAMGAGDYFFTTPLIIELKRRYPDLSILAFATVNAGSVNSPLTPELLRANPNIDEVRLFDGKQTRDFKNYDYSDALRQAPPNYLAIPVFSEHLPRNRHRVVTTFETFGLEAPADPPVPVIPLPSSPPPHVAALLASIKQQCSHPNVRGVAFLQVDARSSNYVYPHADALAAGLAKRGYFVLSASKLANPPALSHVLNFNEFKLMDSIHLLALLRQEFTDMRIVSVASVFWSVSAAFSIPNLGMQHFPDDAMHNYWYPNITIITHRDYPRVPRTHKFVAKPSDYVLDGRNLAVFSPGFVLNCFDKTEGTAAHGSVQESLDQHIRKTAVS